MLFLSTPSLSNLLAISWLLPFMGLWSSITWLTILNKCYIKLRESCLFRMILRFIILFHDIQSFLWECIDIRHLFRLFHDINAYNLWFLLWKLQNFLFILSLPFSQINSTFFFINTIYIKSTLLYFLSWCHIFQIKLLIQITWRYQILNCFFSD